MEKPVDPLDEWLLQLRRESKALQVAYCYGSFTLFRYAKVAALVAKIDKHLATLKEISNA